MAQIPPVVGPINFHAVSSGPPEAHVAHAAEFIAERMAGIEWQLAQLNDKLFKIQASVLSIASARP